MKAFFTFGALSVKSLEFCKERCAILLQDYKKFWENFGKFVKLGCIEDTGNHKRITPLLRFFSSKSEEELISLDDYVENMGENQKAIYYLATDSLQSARTAPFLEKLVQKGVEVCTSSQLFTGFVYQVIQIHNRHE